MIGDGWDGEPSIRPGSGAGEVGRRRRVVIVTGSRAEFGLLRPIMKAVERNPRLELLVVAAGSHLVQPALTFRDVKKEFKVADSVPMQVAGRTGRVEDVESVGRGVSRFARCFAGLAPDWIVVLGDRIEAFAAAAAGSIGGWAVAHVHGGDRAEGIADEAMRHAITKMAHLHLAATAQSAERIVRMGERPEHVEVIGSPALDDLPGIPELGQAEDAEFGTPDTVVLVHPVGRTDEAEEAFVSGLLEAVSGRRVLALHPNLDPGRAGVLRAIELSGVRSLEHLPREKFVGLLKRVASRGGVLVGNSSSGLIEAAALGLRVVDIGPRQNGREKPGHVVHCGESPGSIAEGLAKAIALDLRGLSHPYGDGRAGERAAAALLTVDPSDPRVLRKRCAY